MSLLLMLLILLSSSPISATDIEWGINVGDEFEFGIETVTTKNDTHTKTSDIMFPLWYDWGYENVNGSHYDYLVPKGIYQNETVIVIIEDLPNNTLTSDEIYVNGDYAKASIITPRENRSLFISPWVSSVQYFIPIDPDISVRFEHYNFDKNGVLQLAVIPFEKDDIDYNFTVSRIPNGLEGIIYDLILSQAVTIGFSALVLFVILISSRKRLRNSRYS